MRSGSVPPTWNPACFALSIAPVAIAYGLFVPLDFLQEPAMHNPVVHFECFSKDPATLSNLYEKIFGWKVQDMAGLASPSSTTTSRA